MTTIVSNNSGRKPLQELFFHRLFLELSQKRHSSRIVFYEFNKNYSQDFSENSFRMNLLSCIFLFFFRDSLQDHIQIFPQRFFLDLLECFQQEYMPVRPNISFKIFPKICSGNPPEILTESSL